MIKTLVYLFGVLFLPLAGKANPCLLAFTLHGHKAGSLVFHHEIHLCYANKKDVLLEVESSVHPTRSIILSEKDYFEFVNGFKNTFSGFSHAPPANRVCRQQIRTKIDWEGLQNEFVACEGDANSEIVLKLNQLVQDLYDWRSPR